MKKKLLYIIALLVVLYFALPQCFITCRVVRLLFQNNFGEIVQGEIFRSSQPTERLVERLVSDYDLKCILSLGGDVEYVKSLASSHGLMHVPVVLSAKRYPTDQELEAIFMVVSNEANHPLLIHCQAGADRTGLVSFIYRTEFMNWSESAALEELYSHCHNPIRWPKVTEFLGDYQKGYVMELLRRECCGAEKH